MSGPDPIPVYIGDDWSFAFSYREAVGNGAPVDLTGTKVIGSLFYPYESVPLELTEVQGLTGLIDAAEGKFGIGVLNAMTKNFQATPSQNASALSIAIVENGLMRTIGVWPLLILSRRTVLQPVLQNLSITDPITGRILTFDGLTDIVPVGGSNGSMRFDFSKPSNFLMAVL